MHNVIKCMLAVSMISYYATSKDIINNMINSTNNTSSIGMLHCALGTLKSASSHLNLIAFSENVALPLMYVAVPITLMKLSVNDQYQQNTNDILFFDFNIIIIEKIMEYKILIDILATDRYFNRRGKYLVIYTGYEDVENILLLSWAEYILNIAIFEYKNSKIYTYDPYKNNVCSNRQNISNSMQTINNIDINDCSKYDPEYIFPNKVPLDFNGCTIKVGANTYTPFVKTLKNTDENSTNNGFEAVLINSVLKKLNLRPEICVTTTNKFGFKYMNGSYDAPLQQLIDNDCDLICGHMTGNESFLEDFDLTSTYNIVKFTWIVPTAQLGAQWKSIFLIFDANLWIFTVITILSNGFIWYLFGRRADDIRQMREIIMCILSAWCSVLLGSLTLPKSFKLRVLVIAWVLFSILLTTYYQSKLLSILIEPVYEAQIATVEDLSKSDLRIFYLDVHSFFVRNSVNIYQQRIYEQAVAIKGEVLVAMRLKFEEDTAFLGSEMSTKSMLTNKKFVYSDGRPKLFVFDEVVKQVLIVAYVKEGNPLLERINTVIDRFLANGIFYKWIKDMLQSGRKVSSANVQIRLKFTHLAGAFMLLVVGLVAAILWFTIELTFHKYFNKN